MNATDGCDGERRGLGIGRPDGQRSSERRASVRVLRGLGRGNSDQIHVGEQIDD